MDTPEFLAGRRYLAHLPHPYLSIWKGCYCPRRIRGRSGSLHLYRPGTCSLYPPGRPRPRQRLWPISDLPGPHQSLAPPRSLGRNHNLGIRHRGDTGHLYLIRRRAIRTNLQVVEIPQCARIGQMGGSFR